MKSSQEDQEALIQEEPGRIYLSLSLSLPPYLSLSIYIYIYIYIYTYVYVCVYMYVYVCIYVYTHIMMLCLSAGGPIVPLTSKVLCLRRYARSVQEDGTTGVCEQTLLLHEPSRCKPAAQTSSSAPDSGVVRANVPQGFALEFGTALIHLSSMFSSRWLEHVGPLCFGVFLGTPGWNWAC